MSLTVNLWSRKEGELKRFLSCYYECDVEISDSAGGWFHEYARPAEAVDIISAVIDNSDRFQITMYIQLGDGRLYKVTEANHNDVIRDIFMLFCNDGALCQEYPTMQ
ncbi:MAG TPA: hypothetical protein PK127_04805 [Clostridiales bacterium]|nr:hypothetical protein [Clostridiales bacterium]HPV01776.1 hypothetical protein [Clostridiales bacterium]